MKFTINRDALLKPLQVVSGAVERRSTLPILSNVLIQVGTDSLRMTGTDLEVELVSSVMLEGAEPGDITVPAKKLLDIVRSLADGADVRVESTDDKVIVRSGKSRFTLSSLPASEYPNIEDFESEITLQMQQGKLKHLIERTHFSMANQDVRYYLNGMLFEVNDNVLRTVATDGHRLAMATCQLEQSALPHKQVIVPRKGISELMRLLDADDTPIQVYLGQNHIRVETGGMTFTSKLLDGRFPDYRRVIPTTGERIVIADRDLLKQSCVRVAILSNEKFRGVRIVLEGSEMCLTANNQEQEKADERLEVEYSGDNMEVGFNVNYLLDVVNAIEGSQVKFTLTDENSSALVEDAADDSAVYVIMPMRL
ncbi:DNA polymerase III subunit beta [Aliidiomarina taiwanensis]|uniref:Beta sliding clamp n=1 Tax=Aliidiomarina taiwanensis TaxID=946228 RepID=A0A432X8N6_9GAMM|nr:DNA polymerase III subunit beta [Aliidiomarina taiwanensis]RUO43686.1 DNA polymerase III subunit beta [Aliidiomarina taiwanensis]